MSGIHSTSQVTSIIRGVRATADRPLASATTMPPLAYCTEELFAIEVERVFRPGWLKIGRVSEVPNPGDYKSVDIVGEQLVLCRDRNGELHVLSRICRHRWMQVITGSGNTHAFQCPYHLWTYSLEGHLVGSPEMQGVDHFDRNACILPEFRHEVWQGFVFVNLDGDAKPLNDELAPLTAQLAAQAYPIDFTDAVEFGSWNWTDRDDGAPIECDWDWKVLVENFMECYHHLGPHAKSLQAKSPAALSWTDESNHAYSLMHGGRSEDPDARGRPDAKDISNLIHIYPLLLVSCGGPSMHALTIEPLGAGRCRVVSNYYAPADQVDELLEKGTIETRIAVSKEDFEACRGVQRAVRARSAGIGRLSLLEQPLWEFYQYYASRLSA